jgi:uncharacterized protein YaiI (UPF0178 family)
VQLENFKTQRKRWMRIFVDADAFANSFKEILLRRVCKDKIPTTFVANKKISIPKFSFITMEIVAQGIDKADNFIIQACKKDDLVITADIPLASKVIQKGAMALDPRGKIYDEENINSLLAMRNLMQELRDSGEITKGPKAIDAKSIRNFANSLQKLLSKAHC